MEGQSVDYYVDDVPLGKREMNRHYLILPEQLSGRCSPFSFVENAEQRNNAPLFDTS